jgi:hypothetical protein
MEATLSIAWKPGATSNRAFSNLLVVCILSENQIAIWFFANRSIR